MIVAVGPCVAHVECIVECAAFSKGRCDGAILDGIDGISPILFCIRIGKRACHNVINRSNVYQSGANLSALDFHQGAVKHQTVFAAAIHGSRDERHGGFCFFDFQVGGLHHTHGDDLGISDRVGFATAAAENPATVVLVRVVVGPRHQRATEAYSAAGDGHGGQACIFDPMPQRREIHDCTRMSSACIGDNAIIAESAHRA